MKALSTLCPLAPPIWLLFAPIPKSTLSLHSPPFPSPPRAAPPPPLQSTKNPLPRVSPNNDLYPLFSEAVVPHAHSHPPHPRRGGEEGASSKGGLPNPSNHLFQGGARGLSPRFPRKQQNQPRKPGIQTRVCSKLHPPTPQVGSRLLGPEGSSPGSSS